MMRRLEVWGGARLGLDPIWKGIWKGKGSIYSRWARIRVWRGACSVLDPRIAIVRSEVEGELGGLIAEKRRRVPAVVPDIKNVR